MNRIIYVLPRKKRAQKRPFRIDAKPGELALIANVIGVAVDDYFCGDPGAAEDARWYFAGATYRAHVSALGLAEDVLPSALVDRAIILEA